MGIRDKTIKLRLLKEKNFDLDKTLIICWSNEAAYKELDFIKQDQS